MNTKRCWLFCAAALGAVWLAGCSTPETRIKNDPEAFSRLNPDQQALVKAGQVGIGFDMSAVKLALGDPDRITVRTNAQGQVQTWHYVEYATYDGAYLYAGPFWGGYRHRGWGGSMGWWAPEPFYPLPVAREFDRFRIEFKDGKVTSIAQEMEKN
jgi:outer membrane protein assembly factor BamE (lipoprotein component of BamABCDE complex)